MNWLEELCQDHNVTRYQLSKSTGISQSYLSKIIKENISFFDIKVSQYISIIEFFKQKKYTPSTVVPVRKFTAFDSVMLEYDNLLKDFHSGSISLDDYLNKSSLLLTKLSAFQKSYKEDDYEVHICKRVSYLNAIVPSGK